jgi:2-amino-4-hydroxy-6-hydroxymethyldihydropteridine diphosphokinase
MITAYIALGSNQQCPEEQLRRAVKAIGQLGGSRILQVSPVYRSAAVGPGEQPDYLNAVVALETGLSPGKLLQALQDIEHAQGRVRTERWGPRTLDLDILLYSDHIIATPELTIPHRAIAERNFVLYPLIDLAGREMVLPGGTDLDTLVANCPGGELTEAGLDLNSEAACQQ